MSLFSQCRRSFHQSSYTATLHFKFMFPFNLHIPPVSSFSRHECPHCISWKMLLAQPPPCPFCWYLPREQLCTTGLLLSLSPCTAIISLISRGGTVLLHSSQGMGQASCAQGNRAGGDGPSWQLHHKGNLMKFPSCLVTHKLLCIKNMNYIKSTN